MERRIRFGVQKGHTGIQISSELESNPGPWKADILATAATTPLFQKLQKFALRIIYFGGYQSHTVSFFFASNILPVEILPFKSIAILVYNVGNDLLPLRVSSHFTNNIHERLLDSDWLN